MFKIRMSHTKETCLKLARVQNQCFGGARKAIRIILAAVFVLLGYAVGFDTMAGVLLVAFACFFYYKTAFMYERDGERAFIRTSERFLDVEYEFDEDSLKIRSGGMEKCMGYPSFYALVFDQRYGYLFINGQQAYMVDFETMDLGKPEELRKFLADKTGMVWKQLLSTPARAE